MVLRYVLLVDDDVVPAWQADAIDRLLASGTAEIVLIVRNGAPARMPVRNARWRQLLPKGRGLWQLFERLAARRASAIRAVPLPSALDGTARRTTDPALSPQPGESFAPDDLAAIAAARPDVIIRFGFGILKGAILTLAPHGIWSFHHGDPAVIRGQPPGFWEIALGLPATGVILQRLGTQLDAGVILHQGWFKTIAHSYARQRDQLYFGAAPWLARTSAAVLAGTLREEPQTQLGSILRKPTNIEFLRFAWTTAMAIAGVHLRSLFRHQDWTIAVSDQPVQDTVAALASGDPERVRRTLDWRRPESGYFLADPFPMATGDGIRIYAERLPWKTDRGEIVALDYTQTTGFGAPTAILQPAYHCSYPFLWEDGERRWCIPETGEAGETRYVPIQADGTLAPSGDGGTLLPEALIDPTIVRHDDRYWLFASDADNPNVLLNIFHAERVEGPWTAHTLNPVKTDIRGARPAGRPFLVDGALIRPAQDCSRYYGGAIRLNRIVALTPTDFREETWQVLAPQPGRYAQGLHTISWTGRWTVIDGARTIFSPAEFTRVLKGKLGLAGSGQR